MFLNWKMSCNHVSLPIPIFNPNCHATTCHSLYPCSYFKSKLSCDHVSLPIPVFIFKIQTVMRPPVNPYTRVHILNPNCHATTCHSLYPCSYCISKVSCDHVSLPIPVFIFSIKISHEASFLVD